MPKQLEAQKVPTNMPSQARRPTNWSNMLTYISVLILVGTEIFGIALAGAWAIGGLVELGDSTTMALYVLFGAGAVWAMYVLESGRMGSMTGSRLNQNVCHARTETRLPVA
jgi:threonine/homoserine efflux transporter RhtA